MNGAPTVAVALPVSVEDDVGTPAIGSQHQTALFPPVLEVVEHPSGVDLKTLDGVGKVVVVPSGVSHIGSFSYSYSRA